MYHLPKPRRRKHIVIDQPELPQLSLHMYEMVPSLQEIHISVFEDVAVERCLLLKILESAAARGLVINSDEWRGFIRGAVLTQGLTTYFACLGLPNGKNAVEAKQHDHVAHYILRLAYCKSIALRNRFCQLEKQLFSLKFSYLTADEQKDLFKVYCKDYEPIDSLEKLLSIYRLSECSADNVDVENTNFYLVPFSQASKSLSARNVYMCNGEVYLPESQLIECLEYAFAKSIKTGLTEVLPCLEFVERDERIKNVLYNLETLTTARRNTFKSTATNRVELDAYVKNNYPLCMYTLHQTLSTKHHLKHEARLQYGRFLKDAGFECDEVLSIFREHFCKAIDESKFMKKYSYCIRYMYGLLGRQRVQNGYNCAEILEKEVACGREHGCPYKHWDKTQLRQVLLEKGLVLQGS